MKMKTGACALHFPREMQQRVNRCVAASGDTVMANATRAYRDLVVTRKHLDRDQPLSTP